MAEFKNKFIAFVDVLGFKSFVAKAEKGASPTLAQLLETTSLLGSGDERARFAKHGPTCCPHAPRIDKNLDFTVTQISDCTIVSAEVSPAGAINIISHCWGAVIELLARGFMCRGYIKRGSIYHTEENFIGSGYQDAYSAESNISAFKREADERGTPYVEVDQEVVGYIAAQSDACVKEMFSRMVKRDGEVAVLFPFKRLAHEFMVAGFGVQFDPEKEREANIRLSFSAMTPR